LILSSKSVLEQSLRRIKPEKHLSGLSLRERSVLPFLSALRLPFPKLLLDTTVYIDTVQGVQPEEIDLALRSGNLWHSTVTEAELASLSGLLDPKRADTQNVVAQLSSLIEMRPAHRILNPDREIWREAGILAGLLARLQGYGKSDRRRALNDALIFLTAAKHGCAVLTRNLSDFDLLLQLDPRGSALFYDRQ
jgi:predicted nucleic acid-binding protein